MSEDEQWNEKIGAIIAASIAFALILFIGYLLYLGLDALFDFLYKWDT